MLQAKCDGKETAFFCRIVKVEIESNDCGFAQVQLELVFNLRLKMMTLELNSNFLAWDERLAFYCLVLTFTYLIKLSVDS